MPQRPRLRWLVATRSVSSALVAALAILAGQAPPAHGATECTNVACGTVCTPGAPVQISTLVPFSEFPTGATTPIAFVDPLDGRGRRLIATQEGAILMWDGRTEEVLPTLFLDLRSSSGGPVEFDGERGLLALAVDPDYALTGHLYVFYTRRNLGAGTLGDVVIARYTRSAADPDVADPASALQILVIEHSSAGNHNGGALAFGPNDGFLYISTGDGGGSCDGGQGTSGDSQRSNSLHGKLLRIDVRNIDPLAGAPDDCKVGTGNYTVPSTNPFFGQEPACDEVWAMGLRNPFRFTFDRDSGDIYVGDVGQNKWEEINIQAALTAAPVNWGWACREGSEASSNAESNCSIPGCPVDAGTTSQFPRPPLLGGFWDPPLCHHNGGWASIMGGYRYRGHHVPSLAGSYFYGDPACGQFWRTTTLDTSDQATIASSCWASGFGGTYGMAEDHLGELYIVIGGAGINNRIDCIHNGDGCHWAGAEFLDGFESGDTSAWSDEAPP